MLLTILISYLIVTTFGYFAHWILHEPWLGYFNRSHLKHHNLFYPPTDFTSSKYRSAGKDASSFFFIILGTPILVIPVVILWITGILPFYIGITYLITISFIGYLHDYLHAAFHLNSHWLLKTPLKNWFLKTQYFHYIHHFNFRKNFGIFTFYLDKILKTYTNDISI